MQTGITIPPLKPHEGSYAVIHTETGECVLEMFKDDKRIPYLKADKFHLVPIGEYLASLNKH
jgi:hypothetical protein